MVGSNKGSKSDLLMDIFDVLFDFVVNVIRCQRDKYNIT